MRRQVAALAMTLFSVGILLAVALVVPVELRHTAPFGFRQTLDRSRGIAVSGVTVTSNYPSFNRVDLDLRAYTPEDEYDFTVFIRPLEGGAEPVRAVRVTRPYDDIAVDKAPLADPFTTVRFDPISDSEGQSYYVWVERGPRNQDDIVALWSVKSYSRVAGTAAVAALVSGLPGDMPSWVAWMSVIGFMLLFVVALGGLILVLARSAWSDAWLPSRPDGGMTPSETRG